jgi:hypothetical protein
MQRRSLLAALLASLAAYAASFAGAAASPAGANRTRWKVRSSEGFDALAFLGPLSGTALYLDYYAQDAAAFAPRLPLAVRHDIAGLWQAATAEGFGLLGPNLAVLFSANGNDATVDTLLSALRMREQRILPTRARTGARRTGPGSMPRRLGSKPSSRRCATPDLRRFAPNEPAPVLRHGLPKYSAP